MKASSLARTLMAAIAASGCGYPQGGCPSSRVFGPDAIDAGVPLCNSTDPGPFASGGGCLPYCGHAASCCLSNEQPLTVECTPENCGAPATGRRPYGFRTGARVGGVAGYFVQRALLEHASVAAFRVLADDLVRLGAPRRLVREARRARRDELRHARAVASLARRFGGRARTASVNVVPERPLEAVATENAAEGCVRETWGALVASWQASRSRDACVRPVMKRIARDETRHAALAWSVHSWAMGRLGRESRERVHRAMRDVASDLRSSLREGPHPHLVEAAGLPSAAEAERLFSAVAGLLRLPLA